MIAGIILFFVGVLYIVNFGLDFGSDSLNGITISAVGVILILIGAFLWKMKKVNPIKQDYEELGDPEQDSNDQI